MRHDNNRHLEYLPKGWYSLYNQLLIAIEKLDRDFRIVQAKQKFGELRVYLDDYVSGTHNLIDAATRASKETCEVCGSSAILRVTRGLYQTLCDVHGAEAERVQRDPIRGRLRMSVQGLTKVNSPPDSKVG